MTGYKKDLLSIIVASYCHQGKHPCIRPKRPEHEPGLQSLERSLQHGSATPSGAKSTPARRYRKAQENPIWKAARAIRP